jgi:hypothetical protein
MIGRGDIDSDGVDDLVVAFNVEGACDDDKGSAPGTCGNHVEAYLKVFFGKVMKEGPVLAVGSPGSREITGLRIADGAITAETLKHGESDDRWPAP